MKNNTGGPAFPEVRIRSSDNYNPPTKTYYGGMTLRDYFAAKAMSSVIGDFLVSGEITGEDVAEVLAKQCYVIADAMLEVRKP